MKSLFRINLIAIITGLITIMTAPIAQAAVPNVVSLGYSDSTQTGTGATNVSVAASFLMGFDIAVTANANWRHGYLRVYATDAVWTDFTQYGSYGGDAAYSGWGTANLTFKPHVSLTPNTKYYFDFNGLFLKSNDGSGDLFPGIGPLGGGTKDDWSFTTGPDTISPTANLYPNDINDTDKHNVLINSDLIMVFDENIIKGTGLIELRRGSDDSIVESFDVASSAQISISGATVTIDPTSNLNYNTDYYVLIGTNTLKDLSNNYYAGITSKLVWEFTSQWEPVLVAHLPLDGNTTDVSTGGTNHNGTIFGAPTYIADRFDSHQALSLDGVNDYVVLTNSSIDLDVAHLGTTPTNYSFNIWYKANTNNQYAAIVSKASANYHNGVQYLLSIDDSSLDNAGSDDPPYYIRGVCQARAVTVYPSGTGIDDTWHMLTWVAYYDNKIRDNRWKIYFDGVFQGWTGDISYQAIGIDVLLGARRDLLVNTATTDFFEGAVDDFRFYDGALTSEQVMELFQWTPPPSGTIIIIQ